jgi:hypothetical protein
MRVRNKELRVKRQRLGEKAKEYIKQDKEKKAGKKK